MNVNTTKPVAHTPTPWRVAPRVRSNSFRIVSGSIPICEIDHWGERQPDLTADLKPDGQPQANARLIVRAVNSHAALVEACEALMEHLTDRIPDRTWTMDDQRIWAKGNAALALAKEVQS